MPIKLVRKFSFAMSLSGFVYAFESLLPVSMVAFYRKTKKQRNYRKWQSNYKEIVRKIRRRKGPIRVVFFALDSNTWKYDSVFQAMQNDPLFYPLVLAVPQVNKGRDFMLYQLKHGMDYYTSKGYPALCSYNEETDSYVDALSLKPDIVFFSNPYDGLVDDRYNIRHFFNTCLTCYVNYAYCNVPKQYSCASLFHQKVWNYYVECEENLNEIKKYYSGNNCVVTGYPTADLFSSTIVTGKDWKRKNESLKRVIWAPHHTIEGNTSLIQFSTFLYYYADMLKIAEDYKGVVQFVFKPHPLLKPALYGHPDWGKERTDAYFDYWANGDNTAYINGDYIDLFKSSDALIHDCGSFIIEYLYVQKPVMILGNCDRISQSNEVGRKAYACHYEGKSEKDIRMFIDDVVIKGADSLNEKRSMFYKENLLPPNGMTVAENIVADLKKKLIKEKRC